MMWSKDLWLCMRCKSSVREEAIFAEETLSWTQGHDASRDYLEVHVL